MTTTTMRKHATTTALLCASIHIDYSSALTDMFHTVTFPLRKQNMLCYVLQKQQEN